MATLDDMIQEIAVYTDTSDEVVKTNGEYTGEALPYYTKFKSAINYVKNKIARDKFTPRARQTITLDSTLIYDLTSLNKTYVKIFNVYCNDTITTFEEIETNKIYFKYNSAGDQLVIEYGYMPGDLSILTDTWVFPEGLVDWKIACYYAAYMYFLIEGGAKDKDSGAYFLNLYNDGFDNIVQNIKINKTITSGGGLY